MKWSWRIARIAGIGIYIHATFLILPVVFGFLFFQQRGQLLDALWGVAFILILFTIVVMHELGHALTAKRFGIRTRDITLLPIGGVARLERMPEKPTQELLVALAGPTVNVVLAGALFGGTHLGLRLPMPTDLDMGHKDFLVSLMWTNLFLAAFNLLPAFPMDGGRVLRALLAMKLDYARATRIASMVGQGMAVLFGVYGVFVPQPFLVLIAVFVWVGAAQEAGFVQTKWALNGVPIERVMITDFKTVSPYEPLSSVVEHILAGFQHDFPVVEEERVVGVLTRTDLLKALAQQGQLQRVGEVMQQEFETAQPDEMAERAFERLQRCQCHSLPVLSDGKLVGIVTMENVGEFLAIQEALQTKGKEESPLRLRRSTGLWERIVFATSLTVAIKNRSH